MIRAVLLSLGLLVAATTATADRIKDMATVAGVRSNPLVGYGVVVGLSGTGDGDSGLTLQSMQSMLSRMGLAVEVGDIDASNAAAVMVTAELGAFLKEGQEIDVTVSTVGAAESLKGGTLLMTPLMGADGEIYAIAQGNLIVGGMGLSAEDGSSLTVNIPTVGRVPNGGTVERMVESPFQNAESLILNLNRSDFSTAANVAEAINNVFGGGVAVALDGTSIQVRAPVDLDQRVSFMGLIENIQVTPDAPAAKVVVNSRTGTVVIGGEVLVTPAAVTHGGLTVQINEDFNVDQNATVTMNDNQTVIAPGQPTITPDSQLYLNQDPAKAFLFDPGVSLASLVDAINAVGAAPGDLVAILEALREAGALRAELVVI
ncbi:flagellar basal body P-ring protein FlgI [Marivivens donghaensis]|uniref:Flagellar P-ring protein n=1 Tax=Marivivens donghaensis TaxID=1699413 RepID=A0ABX0VUL0_9RHOB|nr:flagellar basal body P-ring protein FlgI [Marivivens donghaensis]NIY70862.1 flagellar basal body P-ring protein FlgI [Marivivens donghaensis]